jgi:hypothetical protein
MRNSQTRNIREGGGHDRRLLYIGRTIAVSITAAASTVIAMGTAATALRRS